MSAQFNRLASKPLQRIKLLNRIFRRLGVARAAAYLMSSVLSRSGNIAVSIPGGSLSLVLRRNTSDRTVFHNIFFYDELGFSVKSTPSLIVDLGAYTGISTSYFAARFTTARIVAVEPVCSNYEMLERNTKGIRELTLVRAAIGSAESTGDLENPSAFDYSYRIRKSEGRAGDIRIVPLEKVLVDCAVCHIDLLKVDIEGAEAELFGGFPWGVSPPAVICVETHDRIVPGITERIINQLSEYYDHSKSGEYHVFDLRK